MTVTPYLIFNGNCEEALNFYAGVLGGEIRDLMRFADAPPDVQANTDDKQMVLHATFRAGGVTLMASDSGQSSASRGMEGGPVHLSLDFDNPGQLENAFAKMSEGGTVTMPLQDTFWGARFGMLTDRFGVNWMFNHDKRK